MSTSKGSSAMRHPGQGNELSGIHEVRGDVRCCRIRQAKYLSEEWFVDWVKDIVENKSVAISFFVMVATMFSSFMALLGVMSNNRHNKLSVAPMITASVGCYGNKYEFVVTLENEGLGPATIVEFYIYVKGVQYDVTKYEKVQELASRLCDGSVRELGHFQVYTMAMGSGTILGHGKQVIPIRVIGHNVDEVQENNRGVLGVKVVYKDSYGVSWIKWFRDKDEICKKSFLSARYLYLKIKREEAPIGI